MPGIAILDSGGQYCHLIARRVRDLGVYSEILPLNADSSELEKFDGFIISGGPSSVYEKNAPQVNLDLFHMRKPLLGICYGQQLLVQRLGGEVSKGTTGEYGVSTLEVLEATSRLFRECPTKNLAWMSHGDTVVKLPPNFKRIALTKDCDFAAVADEERGIYGLQFHPEVTHTQYGSQILKNFLFDVCHAKNGWNPGRIADDLIKDIRERVGRRKVYFLVSGGVDSTVAFSLCAQALDRQKLEGIYVDTGFMRKNESSELKDVFSRLFGARVRTINASKEFLGALNNVSDPEEKRRIIGGLFVKLQNQIVKELDATEDDWMLGQGTIYPDTIESGGSLNSSTIKTHHNRVKEIAKLDDEGRLLEPLQSLYKDEVRRLGVAIGLPTSLIERQPFPGPGLAIRILCSECEGEARKEGILQDLLTPFGLHTLTVPLQSVGVQGDGRSYSNVTLLSGTKSYDELADASSLITNKFKQTNRVILQLRGEGFSTSLRVHRATITPSRVRLLQEADSIVQECMTSANLQGVWQFPVVLLPLSASGQSESIVLRPVTSIDGMTAEFARLPFEFMEEIATRVLDLPEIDNVFLDITNKPPATIEWE